MTTHTLTEEILKESTDRILLALKHKGIDVKRPDFIIEHEVRKELQSSIDVPDTENIGSNTTWNEFVKKVISQALHRKDEEWKEKLRGLRMEKMVCKDCGNDEFEWDYDTVECIKCKGIATDYNAIGMNQTIDEFNKKVDELLK